MHRDFSDYIHRLAHFIETSAQGGALAGGLEEKFNALALELFHLQARHNEVYRRFAAHRQQRDPSNWLEIPAMPTASFKEFEVTSTAEPERIGVFHSSGTTGQAPSRHFHSAASLEVYELALARGFQRALGSLPGHRFMFLTPDAAHAPRSSLAYMFATLARGRGDARFFGEVDDAGDWRLDIEGLVSALRECSQPALLAGTAFNFVHLLDSLVERKMRIALPPGSIALQTGGFKGRSRALSQAELFSAIRGGLGVETIRSEYGMSELSSQAYDDRARSHESEPVFLFPPWARARLARPARRGSEAGLLEIVDLANIASCVGIQTGDLARMTGEGFVLHGRAADAEPRGCSLRSAEVL